MHRRQFGMCAEWKLGYLLWSFPPLLCRCPLYDMEMRHHNLCLSRLSGTKQLNETWADLHHKHWDDFGSVIITGDSSYALKHSNDLLEWPWLINHWIHCKTRNSFMEHFYKTQVIVLFPGTSFRVVCCCSGPGCSLHHRLHVLLLSPSMTRCKASFLLCQMASAPALNWLLSCQGSQLPFQ